MTSSATVGVVVVAAGSGTRLGADLPKAFVALGGGTILSAALVSVFGMPEPAQVVIVAPADQLTLAQDAHDFQGAAVADGTIKRLLCESCTGLVGVAINAVKPDRMS